MLKKSNFEELFGSDSSVSIRHQNIRFAATEMFRIFKYISLQIVKKIFQLRDAVP